MVDKVTMDKYLSLKKFSDIELDINISLKNRYVYSMVCKAGSSTVTHHLQTAEYSGSSLSIQDVNNAYFSPHLRKLHFRDDEFVDILSGSDFKKFAFVRNPYSRILSCYLHRIVGEKLNPSKRVLYNGLRWSFDSAPPSFDRFVSFICEQESVEMERHWAVQADSILMPYVEYDFIGKLESLNEDLLRLEKILFSGPAFDHDLISTLNMAPMVTGATKKMQKYYNENLMLRIKDRFSRDFESFGYSDDLPL